MQTMPKKSTTTPSSQHSASKSSASAEDGHPGAVRSTASGRKSRSKAPGGKPTRANRSGGGAANEGNAFDELFGRAAAQRTADGESSPTTRQMAIYEFIRDKIRSRGYGPTVREIGTAFKIRSPNGVVCHLKALERKGFISRGRNMSRAIELVTEPAHLSGLPMAGLVAAGTLRPAEGQTERIDFAELFSRDNHFVLKVTGDSMIDAQIADGDWVVIRKARTAHSGDIVVAQTEEGEATLKQWFPEQGRVRLQPANTGMKPMYVKNPRVLGVLVGVVRKTS